MFTCLESLLRFLYWAFYIERQSLKITTVKKRLEFLVSLYFTSFYVIWVPTSLKRITKFISRCYFTCIIILAWKFNCWAGFYWRKWRNQNRKKKGLSFTNDCVLYKIAELPLFLGSHFLTASEFIFLFQQKSWYFLRKIYT